MQNLIIIAIMVGIVIYSCKWIYVLFFMSKKNGVDRGKRRFEIIKLFSVFLIHGFIWVPMTTFYNLKYPRNQITGLVQNYISIRPIKNKVVAMNKSLNEKTEILIPRRVKKIISPIYNQTADVLNEFTTRKMLPETKKGPINAIGNICARIGTGITGIFKLYNVVIGTQMNP